MPLEISHIQLTNKPLRALIVPSERCNNRTYLINCDWIYKTILISTRNEIQFIADYKTFTLALPKNTKQIAIDGQVCAFTEGLLLTLSNHYGAIQACGASEWH